MDLIPTSLEALRALVAGDAEAASAALGVTATPWLLGEGWLWRIRLEQVERDPASLEWIARPAVVPGTGVVGHAGFHGPPDGRGMVEVAYSVDPAHRRQGHARTMLRACLDLAAARPEVAVVRASISPDNAASLATLRPFGFAPVGEQWDEEDGRELLFERPAR